MGDIAVHVAKAANLRFKIRKAKKHYHPERAAHKRCGKYAVEWRLFMNQRKKTSVLVRAMSIALVFTLLLPFGTTVYAGKTFAEHIGYQEEIKLDDVLYNTNYYGDYEKEQIKAGFSDVKDAKVEVDIHGYTAFEGDKPEAKKIEGKDNVLFVPNTNKSITWEVNVEKAGFYEIYFEYLPVDGNTLPVTKNFKIDGKNPYDELSNIKFTRHFVDSEKPRTNNLGDHIRPSQIEIQEWTQTYLYDAQGEYSRPLKVALSAGKHTIQMVHIDQPIAIAEFSLVAPKEIKPYSEIKKDYDKAGYKTATKTIGFEAEDKDHVLYKSESSIVNGNDSDSSITPKGVTSKRYNHIAGGTWSTGNQEISWTFEVKESGLYKFAPRFVQSYGNGLSSTRQIKIDGEVPFEEFNEYIFYYDDKGWKTQALADKDGNPYLIYLEEGKHTISMRVVVGQMTEVVHLLNDVTARMSNAYRNITMVTGQNPDLNYDYNLEKQITSLMSDLKKIRDELQESADRVTAFAEKRPPIVNNIDIAIELVDGIIADPEDIPKMLGDFQSTLTGIGGWIGEVRSQAVGIDYMNFLPADAEVVNKKSTWLDVLYGLFANFFLSYTKDYSAIGTLGSANEDWPTVEVWVSRGREWCEILKDLIDSDFSKQHQVNIDLNILPAGMIGAASGPLLLAINAGTEPDVVVGVGSDIPIDYAIRGAMYDVSKFEDFEQVKKTYFEEGFVQVRYEGGTYALPETIGFKAGFIRTDIFDQIGLKVPDTWQEYRDDILPKLYAYNMQGDVPDWMGVFIYQAGGRYYSDHVYSAELDTPEAMAGVELQTKFFTDYGVPISVSQLNRFRSGEIPILFATFAFYQQLAFSAPELTGKWKMIPILGTERVDENGKKFVDRTSGDFQGSCTVMLGSIEEEKKQAAWEFMKWYTGAEAQSSYASRIESTLGIQSRWLPANKEAFYRLPWTTQELEVINSSLDWAKEIPMGLGTYLSGRVISNARNRIIVTREHTVREAMEQADEELDIEMRRKQLLYRVNLEGKELKSAEPDIK